MKRIFNNLRNLRKERGINQENLARSIGVHQDRISKYEQGKLAPSLPVALRLSAELGVPVNEIFYLRKYAIKRNQ